MEFRRDFSSRSTGFNRLHQRLEEVRNRYNAGRVGRSGRRTTFSRLYDEYPQWEDDGTNGESNGSSEVFEDFFVRVESRPDSKSVRVVCKGYSVVWRSSNGIDDIKDEEST